MSCHDTPHCSVCSDAADRATVRAIDGPDAQVELDSGECATVAIDLVPGVSVGDVVLVHQGVAISRLAHHPEGARA